MQDKFIEIGLVNKIREAPMLYSQKKDKDIEHGIIFEFLNKGTTIEEWKGKIDAIETKFNKKVYHIQYMKNNKKIIQLFAIPLKYYKPKVITYSDDYLTNIINGVIVGATGTGKSTCMLNLLTKFVKYIPNVSITVCDFKNDTFSALSSLPNYFGYMDCLEGIQEFYKEFQERLKGNDKERNSKIRVLFIDEYSSFLSSLDKTIGKEVKEMIGHLLKMARSLGMITILGLQRGDSEFFSPGAREQFKCIIGLGNLSREQKQMLFADCKELMNEFCDKLEGYCWIDGIQNVQWIKVDYVHATNLLDDDMKKALSH